MGSSNPTLREWLQEIYDQHGRITSEEVRERARDPASPAHTYVFNVDPARASEEYYLARAHRLIAMVKITIRQEEPLPPLQGRAFYAVPGEATAYEYHPAQVVVNDAAKFESVRTSILRQLANTQRALLTLDAMARAYRPDQAGVVAEARTTLDLVVESLTRS